MILNWKLQIWQQNSSINRIVTLSISYSEASDDSHLYVMCGNFRYLGYLSFTNLLSCLGRCSYCRVYHCVTCKNSGHDFAIKSRNEFIVSVSIIHVWGFFCTFYCTGAPGIKSISHVCIETMHQSDK